MRKHCLKRPLRLLTVLYFLTLSSITHAQVNPPIGSGPLKFASPSPLGLTLNDMSFSDNNIGLAVGVSGEIARTTDGGRNWQAIFYKYVTNTGTYALAQFQDVHFATSSVAYAVASGGLMIKSTDGGINWSPVTTPLTARGRNINALHFLNKDTGYIGGAAINTTNTTDINDAPKVYVTKNGGTTWDSLATPFVRQAGNATLNWNNQKEIHRIHFANDSVGYVSGSSGSDFSGGQSALLWKIEKGIITDYCLHRTKFGITATSGAAGNHTPSVQIYKGLVAVNDSLVLMSSLNNNLVLRVKTGKNDSTANAAPAIYGDYVKGRYEVVVSLTAFLPFLPATLANNVAGQMYNMRKGPDGKIYLTAGNSIVITTDNGTTWSYTKPIPNTVPYGHWGFSAVDVTPNGRIVIGGIHGMTYDSLPGTASWQTTYKNARPFFYALTNMDWADPCNGVVVGTRGAIIKTTDGGQTWVNNTNPVLNAADIGITNVAYPAVNNMFFTTPVTVYRSADQGTTNDAIFTEPNPNSFGFATNQFTMVGKDIAFIAAFRGSPVVERAVIFRSLNASAATPVWDTVKAFPTGNFAPNFKNIRFANKDTGYVTANRGKVYRTVDGGATWNDVSPDTTASGNSTATYSALSVVNGKTLFVGGNSRKLFKSTDAGATWTDLTMAAPAAPIPLFTSISTILMNDANNGYIYAGSLLLKTADAWATWTWEMPPAAFTSMTLYPKITAPIGNKKLYGVPGAGFGFGTPDFVNTNTSSFMEYGTAAVLAGVASTETSINATCTSLTGGSITITATGGIPPYTYSINGGAFQTSNTFNGLTQGAKTIVIKDAGCQSVTKTVTVGFTNNLTVNAGPDKSIVLGGSVALSGSSSNTPQTIQWTPANSLTGATTLTPVAKPDQTTAYILTVNDMGNCIAKDTAVVTVINECIKVMEAFTPNGDGINDKWMVTNGSNCSTKVSVSVFNRYGGVVYKNDNYNNDWNGTYNGKPVTDGTYYYIATISMIGGRIDQVKGNVTILR
jgi:gliding motility-associated-like protein